MASDCVSLRSVTLTAPRTTSKNCLSGRQKGAGEISSLTRMGYDFGHHTPWRNVRSSRSFGESQPERFTNRHFLVRLGFAQRTRIEAASAPKFFTALGTALASRLEDMQGFQLIMNFLIMPIFFLSSALFPLSGLPKGVLARRGRSPTMVWTACAECFWARPSLEPAWTWSSDRADGPGAVAGGQAVFEDSDIRKGDSR